MYSCDLQMAIVAKATYIYKCKRAWAGRAHGCCCRAKAGGCARLRNVAECRPKSLRSSGREAACSGMQQHCAAATAKRAAAAVRTPRPGSRLFWNPSRSYVISFESLNEILQLTTDVIALTRLPSLEHRHDYKQINHYHIITQIQRCVFKLHSV